MSTGFNIPLLLNILGGVLLLAIIALVVLALVLLVKMLWDLVF